MTNQPTNCEPLLEEPTYPEDWECCNNGCEEMCVYELYRVQKQAYDDQQRRLKQLNELAKPAD
ncbi:oxidoreductase-like domain-containing protein [Faucicola boevrei]|uniref:oxidoreductase-like domain-containing protein n=1 Tax=Faucicola boevrei TaxID=346665 RepID=UPI00036D064E|nr:oxidoreductase-like domain-containing protein [Moraxella boevrei]